MERLSNSLLRLGDIVGLISNPRTRDTFGNVSKDALRNEPVPHVGSRIEAG